MFWIGSFRFVHDPPHDFGGYVIGKIDFCFRSLLQAAVGYRRLGFRTGHRKAVEGWRHLAVQAMATCGRLREVFAEVQTLDDGTAFDRRPRREVRYLPHIYRAAVKNLERSRSEGLENEQLTKN